MRRMVIETHRLPRLVVRGHRFEVPLDHAEPGGPKIEVFAREVVAREHAEDDDRPWLVYLQGGPGHESPRPLARDDPHWLGRALDDYRVLLLDQRGTGRSSPVGALPGMAPAEQARYLTHFRADSIVRDAELIRRELGVERWSVLGQSFGGFCIVTYLSLHPDGLREALVAGGLPPLGGHPDDVYRATYATVADKCRRYYERYPEDRERMAAIAERLERGDVRLSGGDRLTPRRFRQIGHVIGMGSGFERLHHIVELPVESPAFVHDVERALPYARNPLYVAIHEACYADGVATRWSAERTRPPEFDDPTLFTGEHIYPWMLEEYGALQPLREAALLLAEQEWGPLYDPPRLSASEVPAAAAVYADDAYVPRAYSEATAAHTRGLRAWITNEYEHDGLGAGGTPRVFERLLDLVRGDA
jgi:pimeloyl-ACP methyl ester carboxylesterase